jgi:hypothetical protein
MAVMALHLLLLVHPYFMLVALVPVLTRLVLAVLVVVQTG